MKKSFFDGWSTKDESVMISFNPCRFMGLPPQAHITCIANGRWTEDWFTYEITIYDPMSTLGHLMMSVKLENDYGVEMYFNLLDTNIQIPMDAKSIDLNALDFSNATAVISKSNMDLFQGLIFNIS